MSANIQRKFKIKLKSTQMTQVLFQVVAQF